MNCDGGFVQHVVAGEEAGDVQGDFPALLAALDVLQAGDPFAEGEHLVLTVVFSGHDEGGQFHMAALHGFLDMAMGAGSVILARSFQH